MNTIVKFEGLIDQILDSAVKKGLAKTKVEALRLGALELNDRYNLLGTEDEQDAMSIRKSRAKLLHKEISLLSEKELDAALRG